MTSFKILTLLIISHVLLIDGYHCLYKHQTKLLNMIQSKVSIKNKILQNKDFNQLEYNKINSMHQSLTRLSTLSNDNIDILKKRSLSDLTMRWITGLSLGAIATLWIASGKCVFALIFFLISITTQNEYFTMVKAAGILPAYKTGNLTCFMCYFTAALFPSFHELVMPVYATYLMLYLLIFYEKSAKISEISTSLLGVFYLGYLPSFWIRLKSVNFILSNAITLNKSMYHIYEKIGGMRIWNIGSASLWFTWTAIVFSDVGAYFIGKNFGKHKLSVISKAAGAASPNKTIEGAIGGLISATIVSMIGAYLMKWPFWIFTGSIYGILMGFIGLIGDLTESMIKRDAGFKDSGNILPGHGGLLDRFDSYILTAPFSFLFIKYILPFFMKFV